MAATLKRFLMTALQPVGATMYVWGGGWDEQDSGAGAAARTIGVSPRWKQFFSEQTSSYDFRAARHRIADGLDCSGYVGWCLYNTFHIRDGEEGYVMPAGSMVSALAARGFGRRIPREKVRDHRAGDIMGSSGHVWIAVGTCGDGSVVILHASPPGVQLMGTPAFPPQNGPPGDHGCESEAVRLAARCMRTHYPEWYRKYPGCFRGSDYLTEYDQMRWDVSGEGRMTDPDEYKSMDAEHILRDLFACQENKG